ncbi:MAG: hypothetical protein R2839_06815 [Thermomicrobiales bacterium]
MQADDSPQHDIVPEPTGEVQPPVPHVFTSGMIDRQEGWGDRRMIAVVAINAPGNHQELNAESLLAELESTFFRASLTEPARALAQAIEGVRSRLLDESVSNDQPASIGVAASVLADDQLYLAVIPPCQAVLWQDQEAVYLPTPGDRAKETPDADSAPAIMETRLSPGDRLALLASDRDAPPDAFVSSSTLETAAGPTGSYVWLEVSDDAPTVAVQDVRDPDEPLPPVPVEQIQASSVMPSHVRTDWKAQATGGPRLLQRPPGSDALRRYRSTGHGGTPSALRSRLPRGVPPTQVLGLIALALLLFSAVAYIAVTHRPERQHAESATPLEYSQAVATAIADEDIDQVTALLPGAHTLLERAGGDDANSAEAVALRMQIVAAEDFLNSVVRLEHPRRVGIIPESLLESNPSLIEAAGITYLLAGDLYVVDSAERQLVALLDLVPEESSGDLIAGGGDISTLAMTSAAASYFFGDAVGGSKTVLPEWPSGFGLSAIDASVFRSRLYVIDLDSAEIALIDPETDTTSLWIQRESEILPTGPIGMAIDGDIHVLYENGDLYALREGYVAGKTTLPLAIPLTEPQAIAYDISSGLVFIADIGAPEGRLIAWNNQDEDQIAIFQLGPDSGGHLDGDAHQSFVQMTDLLVSVSNGTVLWIDGEEIWQADLPMTLEEIDSGEANIAATPEADET